MRWFIKSTGKRSECAIVTRVIWMAVNRVVSIATLFDAPTQKREAKKKSNVQERQNFLHTGLNRKPLHQPNQPTNTSIHATTAGTLPSSPAPAPAASSASSSTSAGASLILSTAAPLDGGDENSTSAIPASSTAPDLSSGA